jgi:hypothetical protein
MPGSFAKEATMSSNGTETIAGRCLCGDIQYEYWGAPLKILHCHCESCRRHTASPVATFVCVARDASRLTKGEPVVYNSSPGVRRKFCGRCGSPISYDSDRNPNQIDFFIGTLNDPSVAPTFHVFAEEQLPWFEIADTLPRYARGQRGEPMSYGPRLHQST